MHPARDNGAARPIIPIPAPSPEDLSFGTAGTLCLGADAEIRQGCTAMLDMYQQFVARNRPSEYGDLCLRIEARAKIVAPLRAVTPDGMKAKAAIVYRLNIVGMAGYGARILAASLALDVLGEVAQ